MGYTLNRNQGMGRTSTEAATRATAKLRAKKKAQKICILGGCWEAVRKNVICWRCRKKLRVKVRARYRANMALRTPYKCRMPSCTALIQVRAYCPAHSNRVSRRHARYFNHLAQGLCCHCFRKPVPGQVYCVDHQAMNRKSASNWWHRGKENHG